MLKQTKQLCGDLNYSFSLSRISHEIRNPLTLIYSTAQLLATKHPSLTEDNLWHQLISDINYLNDLTASISIYNKSQQLSPKMTDITQLLTEVTENYRPLAEKSKKRLILSIRNTLKPIPQAIRFMLLLFPTLCIFNLSSAITVTVSIKINKVIYLNLLPHIKKTAPASDFRLQNKLLKHTTVLSECFHGWMKEHLLLLPYL